VLGHGYATRQARPPAHGDALFAAARPGHVPSTKVNATRARFRVAHVALLGQGLVLGMLGGFALAWSMAANLRFGREGIPVLCLLVTPAHGGLLLIGGALAVVACLGRWTTVGVAVVAVAGWGTLAVISAVEAAHHAPGALGFDHRDTVLYGILALYNLTLCVLLAPAVRDGWRNRSTR
jgi:hypothetical protein